MKAIVINEYGGTDKLVYQDFPDPVAGNNDVIVKVRACSLNHLDLWVRKEKSAFKSTLPHISGCDVAGIVADTGQNVNNVKIGDHVIVSPGLSCFNCDACIAGDDNLCESFKIFGAAVHGGYAEYAKVPAHNVIHMPHAMSFAQAAAFPLTFVTAYHMLVNRAKLRVGQEVLIIAAGSGVGTAAVRIAKLFGARVIATVGSDEKVEQARLIGADEVINYKVNDFDKIVHELTDGHGVDTVFENVGPDTWNKSINCLAKNGKLITCGATSGPDVEINLRSIYMNQLSIYGSILGTRKELFEIIKFMITGQLRVTIDSVFDLKDVKKAQEKMIERKNFGKIVIEINE